MQECTKPQDFEFIAGDGTWQGEGSHMRCDARGSYGFGHIKTARTDLKLELEIVCEPNTLSAGILLEPRADMSQGHLLMIEPGRQRVSIRRWPIKWEPYWQNMVVGSPALGPDMERLALVEQGLPSRPEDDRYHVRVSAEWPTGRVLCKRSGGAHLSCLRASRGYVRGLFVDQGAASFNGIAIKS